MEDTKINIRIKQNKWMFIRLFNVKMFQEIGILKRLYKFERKVLILEHARLQG